MRIDYPFGYQVNAKTPRWRYERNVHIVGFVERDVPELADHDAPVAVEWNRVAMPEAFGRGSPRHARFHDGSFYIPLGLINGTGNLSGKATSKALPRRSAQGEVIAGYSGFRGELMALLPHPESDPRKKVVADWYVTGRAVSEIDGVNGVEISHSDEAEQRALAEDAASRLVLVDGKVYMKVPEPRLVLNTWLFPNRGAEMSVDFTAPSYEDESKAAFSPATVRYFRFDDMDRLEEEAEALGYGVRRSVCEVVVHDPVALSFDRTLDIATRSAAHTMKVTENLMPLMGRVGGNAWYDILEARAAYADGGDRGVFEEDVMQALSVISASLPGTHADLAAELSQCVEMWSSSDIDVGFRLEGARLS